MLEVAASRYAKEEYNRKSPAALPDRCRGCYAPLMYAFKAGANWHKEMMMKDAVGGFVIQDVEEGNGDFLLYADYLPASIGLKDRQKVKVIILKD